MLNDSIECKRGTTERLFTFVSRFWGLASSHLMHAQASQDSQLGKMLAIVLIKNSTLDVNTLASAKLELIRAAEVRALDQNKTVSESPSNHSRCSAARTNVVFTNSYVDNISSLVSE
jgi:hypothetical protein